MDLLSTILQMHDTTATKPNHADLFDIATGQHGYFSTEQACEAGFGRDLLSYHASTGCFIRVQRGLYRFRDYPSSPREEIMAALLAVVSHQTALELLELSGNIPTDDPPARSAISQLHQGQSSIRRPRRLAHRRRCSRTECG